MLIISPFGPSSRRVTSELAAVRNKFVAEIADVLFVPHASVGGKTEQLIKYLMHGTKPVYTVDDSENAHLLASGIQPLAITALAEAF